ncbi:MAG TPA: flagellar motor protein MotB [Syntrophorhabdaceae bacterium]|mgnify:CR=1 FL=1|nr:flagellar motor protein MotB [Syntrophorhabdaceae bacterium]HOT42927.1 flagellar motor protein MotB [Syntrophorhabdaceae bacterium]HPC66255.1 flagellar motor protein MotB [Syntrophorhabdaceae bacterium]HPP41438.1 flagellar motor protein MotB [Syntrophorhabdaceae bacterium]HQE80935.1 flagellar motor protein MotB [Syntrophorhabdaceae bacterium]
MRKRNNNNNEHENLERWLLTYADLITLLLAFFIMMYTFSKQDSQRYEEVSSYLKAIFSGGTGVLQKGNVSGAPPIELLSGKALSEGLREKLDAELRAITGESDLKNSIFIFTDERGVVIRIMDKAFFDEGKAELKQGAKNALDKIAYIIKDIKNHIRIEGHTDNTPISKGEFKSNWELSVRRATEVVRYLIEKGPIPPDRISATGYAEYRPIVDNDTPENKALNRRVEIIIEKTGI